ncbi:MAG: hypothetical protein M1837_007309 [Sclerophora amabilis]|nr:MAG: hypothetical protein M1837_007309 [Sclerophora amabilis]
MTQYEEKNPSIETASLTLSESITLVGDDGIEHFTATGRPMPEYSYSSLANMPGQFGAQVPQSLPWKFTDDDIISVPIPIDEAGRPVRVTDRIKRKSWLGGWGRSAKCGRKKQRCRIVRMTRGDYLKYYARDENGNYIGTEPEGSGPSITDFSD